MGYSREEQREKAVSGVSVDILGWGGDLGGLTRRVTLGCFRRRRRGASSSGLEED